MVSELRHIIFRSFEVVEAYTEFSRRSGTPLPAGTVISCGAENDGPGSPITFRIVIVPDQVGGPLKPGLPEPPKRELVLDSATIAAALILHCHTRRIPLPAAASKSLQMFGDEICLIAALNSKKRHQSAR